MIGIPYSICWLSTRESSFHAGQTFQFVCGFQHNLCLTIFRIKLFPERALTARLFPGTAETQRFNQLGHSSESSFHVAAIRAWSFCVGSVR